MRHVQRHDREERVLLPARAYGRGVDSDSDTARAGPRGPGPAADSNGTSHGQRAMDSVRVRRRPESARAWGPTVARQWQPGSLRARG